MKIERQEHGRRGAFFVEEDGEWTAEMTYVKSGDGEITIDHTEVDESLEGQGVGTNLVAEAVKFARANNLKIRATCPFARSVLQKTDDYADVFVE